MWNHLARKYINQALKRGDIKGGNTSCKYYPCSFDKQDCTWCFCPFYPCLLSHGEFVMSPTGRRIWDCSHCRVVHEPEMAKNILKELKEKGRPIEEIERGEIIWTMRLIKPLRENYIFNRP